MRTNNLKEQEKYMREISKYKHYCKCGHTVVIFPFEKRNKKICNWCGKYVYINEKEEFKDKMRGKLNG